MGKRAAVLAWSKKARRRSTEVEMKMVGMARHEMKQQQQIKRDRQTDRQRSTEVVMKMVGMAGHKMKRQQHTQR